MKKDLKVIDGSITGHAPPPSRGLIRAVYDTVEACGGANITTIRKYLPAAIDNISQVISRKKIKASLYQAVYRGYLIHDGPHNIWKIAPLSYYEARQSHVAKIEGRTQRHGKTGERGPNLVVKAREANPLDARIIISLPRKRVKRVAMTLLVIAVFVLGGVLGRML